MFPWNEKTGLVVDATKNKAKVDKILNIQKYVQN